MGKQTITLVTGSNRGIGLAIVQALSKSPPSLPFTLYAASRSGHDLQLGGPSGITVKYPQLDIGSQASINALAAQIRRDHGGLDVVINNAGTNLDDKYSPENAKRTLDVNYRGTLAMCQAFAPLIPSDGRIVNVSSIGSSLSSYSRDIQARFRSDKMTLAELESLARDYEASTVSGEESKRGWGGPGKSYSVSKACVNAMTAVLAREYEGLTVNACCPGWVDTDMGHMVGSPPKRPKDGAKIPLNLAFGSIDGVTGRYWANDSLAGIGSAKVQNW